MEALSYCQLMERCLMIERKLESVVAENAELKGALNKIAFTYSLSPHIHEMTTIAAPATDAFLAEVRASGVEMLLSSLPPYYTARADIEKFAAQLRLGGAE